MRNLEGIFNTNTRKQFFGDQGVSLVESLIGFSILTVTIFATMGYLGHRQALQNKMSEGTPEVAVTNNLRSILENRTAWLNTLKHPNNSVFNCFKYTSEDCANIADSSLKSQCLALAPLSCRDQVGDLEVVRNSLDENYFIPSSMGFTVDGKPCDPLSPPAEGCPIRAEVAVRYVCPEPDELESESVKNCKSPTIVLTATFSTDGSKIAFDKGASDFVLKKATAQRTCSFGCKEVPFRWADATDGDRSLTAPGLQRPPIKVVMVVDNSPTFANMPAAQKSQLETDMKEWLKPPDGSNCLFCQAQKYGVDISFHILSTTQLAPGAEPVAARAQTCRCEINSGTAVSPVLQGNISVSYDCPICDDAVVDKKAMSFVTTDKFSLLQPNPLATTANKVIEFKYTLNPSKAQEQASEIQSQVWAHFSYYLDASRSSMGDSATRGLCTLARVLRQRPEPELFSYYWGDRRMAGTYAPIVKGDRALFMLFSNQDDETSDSIEDCFMHKMEVRRWQDNMNHDEILPPRISQFTFDSPKGSGDMNKSWKDGAWAKLGPPGSGYRLATFLKRSDDPSCASFPGEVGSKYLTLANTLYSSIGQSLCSSSYTGTFSSLLDSARMIENSIQYTALERDYRIIGVTYNKSVSLEVCNGQNGATCHVFVRYNSLGFTSRMSAANALEITGDTVITLKLEKFNLPPATFGNNWIAQDISTTFSGNTYSSILYGSALYGTYTDRLNQRYKESPRARYDSNPYFP